MAMILSCCPWSKAYIGLETMHPVPVHLLDNSHSHKCVAVCRPDETPWVSSRNGSHPESLLGPADMVYLMRQYGHEAGTVAVKERLQDFRIAHPVPGTPA